MCYRFVGGVSIDEKGFILAEPFHELENNAQFTSLQRARDTLRNANYYYASEVIEMLQSYEGLKYCKLSGDRKLIPISSFFSMGCYVECQDALCILAINGAVIHN
ncbi:hypothetical protein L5515_010570 [Caenorhabditis briggsae]|uniref:Uncharacterized protein n=1 Tax=Caenorhabditis briggsae TaxID=6238 RepID=A0AAE9EUZ4_CAEBR|nr:hypothetical protein L5515_010570 [Caenorhabditis briggsae]